MLESLLELTHPHCQWHWQLQVECRHWTARLPLAVASANLRQFGIAASGNLRLRLKSDSESPPAAPPEGSALALSGFCHCQCQCGPVPQCEEAERSLASTLVSFPFGTSYTTRPNQVTNHAHDYVVTWFGRVVSSSSKDSSTLD